MADNIKIDLLINAAQSAKTIQETKKALKDLKSEALNLTEGTAAFTKVATAAGQLQDKIGDLSATTKYLGDDLKNIKAISGIGQGIASGFAIASGAAALFGGENKKLQESMVKLQAIMAVMQGMEQIGIVLQKQSAAMLGIKNAVTKTAIFLTSEQAVAEAAEAVAAGTATIAQRALNAAMSANPIGLLITLILAGVAALTLWGSKSDAAVAAEKRANEEKKRNIALLKAQQEARDKQNEYIAKEAIGYMTIANELKKSNPGSAERLRLINEINKTYGTTIQNLKDEKKFQDEVFLSVEKYVAFLQTKSNAMANLEAMEAIFAKRRVIQYDIDKKNAEIRALDLKYAKVGSEEYKKQSQILIDYEKKYANQSAEIQLSNLTTKLENMVTYDNKLQKQIIETGLKTKDETDKTDKAVVKSNDAKNKAIEEANIKALENEGKIRDLVTKGITDAEEIRINLMEDGFEKQTALLRRQEKLEMLSASEALDNLLSLLEKNATDKLILEKKYISDVNDSGWKAQQDKIASSVKNNEQLKRLEEETQSALNLIAADYAKKHQALITKDATDYLKAVKDNASYEQSILNEKYKKGEISGGAFLKSTQKLADDLNFIQDEFSKNPNEVYKVVSVDDKVLESVEKQADAIKSSTTKTAEELIQIDTEKNKKLAENQVKANDEIDVIIANHDLAVAEEEKRKAEMKVQAYVDLEQQLQAAALSIFNNAMDQRSKANQKEYDDKIALIDAEQKAYENAQANRTTLQQAQYDTEQGFAEQKKNAERVRQLEEDKIKKKQFNAQKINDAATVAIKTAMAVMGAVQAFPLTGGMPFTAINIAMGAIEEAAILSKKYIPTYATGGLVMGAGTGTSDSIDARLSNGESVINAKSTSMFAPMLSAINQAGGGVAIPHTKNNIFTPSIPNENQVMDIQPLIDAINNKSNEVYVKEVTVTNSQNRADKLKRRTSF